MIQDTLMQTPIDSAVAAVDSVKTVIDSAATVVSGQIGTLAAPWVALALGAVTKIVMEGAKAVSGKLDTLPSWAKAGAVLVIAQAITFVNAKAGALGVPELPKDISLWATAVPGLVVWAAAMGVNALKDAIIKK